MQRLSTGLLAALVAVGIGTTSISTTETAGQIEVVHSPAPDPVIWKSRVITTRSIQRALTHAKSVRVKHGKG